MIFFLKMSFLCFTFIYFFTCVVQHMYGGQRTTAGVGSLLPPCGSQGLNSDLQAWWQVFSCLAGPYILLLDHHPCNKMLSFHSGNFYSKPKTSIFRESEVGKEGS